MSWTNKTYTHEVPSSSPVYAFDGETTLDSFYCHFSWGVLNSEESTISTCLLISPFFFLLSFFILCVSYVALFNCAVVFAKRLSLCLRGWICCSLARSNSHLKQDEPLLKLEIGTNPVVEGNTVSEGADVYFECNIKANPWVYRIAWRHDVSRADLEEEKTCMNGFTRHWAEKKLIGKLEAMKSSSFHFLIWNSFLLSHLIKISNV